jgi:mannosyl-oligosaccharide alpha-1,2-mannosidase
MIDKHMLFRASIPNEKKGADLLFCGDIYSDTDGKLVLHADLQHLTCFIGGMFGLAGRLFKNDKHIDLGEKLTKGCIYAYAAMPTGIMPETFSMLPCAERTTCPWNQTAWHDKAINSCGARKWDDTDAPPTDCRPPPLGFTEISDSRYLLRPEAIESVFIMYRITGDRAYLDHAWDMFTAVVAASRTQFANGQVRDVTFVPGPTLKGVGLKREDNVEDKMESFWTAETLKYFYLVFSREDMISLDDWVFNTEAHPFRRPRVKV